MKSNQHKLGRMNLKSAIRAWVLLPIVAGVGCGTLGQPGMNSAALPPPVPLASGTLQSSSTQSSAVQHSAVQSSAVQSNVEAQPSETGLASRSISDNASDTGSPRPTSAVVQVNYEEPLYVGDAMGDAAVCVDDGFADGFADGSCGMSGCVAGCGACAPAAMPARPKNVQEYIFDGGDQQPTVVIRDDWSSVGVDPTDTVIYYETLGGKVCVKPSNRTEIYAPRFGAVRQITGAVIANRAVGTERILVPVSPGRFDDTSLAGAVTLPVAPHGEEQVNLLDAFQENAAGTPVAHVLPIQRMSEAGVPFESVNVLATGRMTADEIAVMGRFLVNARTWFNPESLGIVIDGQQANLLADTAAAQDVHVYELPDKCSMRICKTASHQIANSGDIVSFTIRFDNVGVKPLGNAVILDSLSPRLEYIVGSQQSSVETRFSSEPNEVGSEILRWEVLAPIEKHDGGVISFDCRVR